MYHKCSANQLTGFYTRTTMELNGSSIVALICSETYLGPCQTSMKELFKKNS